jgi:hypothetical protein
MPPAASRHHRCPHSARTDTTGHASRTTGRLPHHCRRLLHRSMPLAARARARSPYRFDASSSHRILVRILIVRILVMKNS